MLPSDYGSLQAGGCDLPALTYLKRWISFTMIRIKNLELNDFSNCFEQNKCWNIQEITMALILHDLVMKAFNII